MKFPRLQANRSCDKGLFPTRDTVSISTSLSTMSSLVYSLIKKVCKVSGLSKV